MVEKNYPRCKSKNKNERHWELERHTHPLAFENLTVRPQCKLSTSLIKITQTPNGQIFFIQHLRGNQSLCLNKKKKKEKKKA